MPTKKKVALARCYYSRSKKKKYGEKTKCNNATDHNVRILTLTITYMCDHAYNDLLCLTELLRYVTSDE